MKKCDKVPADIITALKQAEEEKVIAKEKKRKLDDVGKRKRGGGGGRGKACMTLLPFSYDASGL